MSQLSSCECEPDQTAFDALAAASPMTDVLDKRSPPSRLSASGSARYSPTMHALGMDCGPGQTQPIPANSCAQHPAPPVRCLSSSVLCARAIWCGPVPWCAASARMAV
eukprot:3337781-Rhodomonas_salina.1